MNQFPCTRCGACCSFINGVDFLKDFNNNGRCIHLKNNQCNIYEKRPLLCRIDETYDLIFSKFMTKEEFYIQNANACNELQERLGIDKKYRVYL